MIQFEMERVWMKRSCFIKFSFNFGLLPAPVIS